MCKLSRKILSALLALALLVSLLPIGAAPAQAAETRTTAGAFEVEGDTSGYSYSDGVLTVNSGADITISMASGMTNPTSDRIAVNGNAEITLNGVNITAPSHGATTGDAQSAIDVSDNGHLVLNLANDTSNVLTSGSGGNNNGAAGIHVPASSSLVIQGSGD